VPKSLVIVESPAKARTISKFLGRDYMVEASYGHVRDLPERAEDVPEQYKDQPWARNGVDPDNDFKALYVVPSGKRKQLSKLKSMLKDADELYLATDEDREGEAISWHLMEVLSPRVPVKRMVFHEITQPAIERAVREWRDLDMPLVDAQETRRILDRLYGYEVSPVLWRKVRRGLSAGRVQSVATRIIVERERQRMAFRAAGWWDIEGQFAKSTATGTRFGGSLVALDRTRLVTGRDFRPDGTLAPVAKDAVRLDEGAARRLAQELEGAALAVRSVDEKPYSARPQAPFITSTLQQEAGRKLRFDARRTMQVAQRLYENGYITYMRTDSTTLSETALTAAREQARQLYGPEYVPAQPRIYTRKVKNAQEAHEAIRPAGEVFRLPDQVSAELGADEFRLYDLIWKRTVASQMADARGQTVQVRFGGRSSGGADAEFATSGKVISFPGFLRAYVEGADDPEAELEDQERPLPALAVGDAVVPLELEPKSHATTPPARYTEASLVKALEDLGVGRPSTYASIIGTIQDRGYVWKKGTALVPSWTAFAVVTLLERHFPHLVDYAFTARLEDDLDEIASRDQERVPWLRDFYFGDGNGEPGLKALVTDHLDEIDAREVNSIPIGDDLVVRVGRYGPYLQRGDERVSIPDDIAPDELTPERAAELLAAPQGPRVVGTDPATGLPITVRSGRFGAYVQRGEQEEGSKHKPARASLFKGMDPATVTIDEAVALLSLPRVVGRDPADGEEITAQNGRFGPYLKKGSDSRSLASEEQLLTIGLDEALAVFAQPKRGRGSVARAPLKELGPDPHSGQPIVVKEGRYGPYVTDGETNATLSARTSDTPENVTLERAATLLQERRDAGPTQKRSSRTSRATASRATASRATASRATASRATASKAAGAAKKRAAPAKKAAAAEAPRARAARPRKATSAGSATGGGRSEG